MKSGGLYSKIAETVKAYKFHITVIAIILVLVLSVSALFMAQRTMTPNSTGENIGANGENIDDNGANIEVNMRPILSEDKSTVVLDEDLKKSVDFSVTGEESEGLHISYVAMFDSDTNEAINSRPDSLIERTGEDTFRIRELYIQYEQSMEHREYSKLTQYTGGEAKEGHFSPQIFDCVSDSGSSRFGMEEGRDVERTVFGAGEETIIESVGESLLWFEEKPSDSGQVYVVPEKEYTTRNGSGQSVVVKVVKYLGVEPRRLHSHSLFQRVSTLSA